MNTFKWKGMFIFTNMLKGSDLLIEQKGYLFSSILFFGGGGGDSAYSTYAFVRGLPQKRMKACKGGGGSKLPNSERT